MNDSELSEHKNRRELYIALKKSGSISMYNLAKKMGWDVAKVSYYIHQLKKRGLIEIEEVKHNGRIVKKISPINIQELVSIWKERMPELFEPATSID